MPETPAQWAWFVFFAGGAIGGWLAAVLAVWWAVETFKIARFLDKVE